MTDTHTEVFNPLFSCGIYCIENMINGKKYIGQSIDLQHRLNCKRGRLALDNAIKKYGEDNFKKYVLIYCEPHDLNRLEIECIKTLHTHVSENGYNISWGGSSVMEGRHHTDESRANISKNNGRWTLGKPLTQDHRLSLSKNHADMSGEKNPMFGKHPSNETRAKMSESRLGKPSNKKDFTVSQETRGKISKTLTGKKQSEETIRKRSESIRKFYSENPEKGKEYSDRRRKVTDGN